jgi:hypothetical protein
MIGCACGNLLCQNRSDKLRELVGPWASKREEGSSCISGWEKLKAFEVLPASPCPYTIGDAVKT